jgi:hypothetical protein
MWPLVAARLACFAMASIGILATLLVAFIHPGTSLRQSRHRRHQPKSEIPIAIARGPRVPSSGTFVRPPAPETLHVSRQSGFRRARRITAVQQAIPIVPLESLFIDPGEGSLRQEWGRSRQGAFMKRRCTTVAQRSAPPTLGKPPCQ